jgi:PhzF family phenazine biosynthesis protein
MIRRFAQVDVFTDVAFRGNPLAVVFDADDLTDEQMARIANWTNLSETTFLLKPIDPRADYRMRIFTASTELPFAGHPTLGTCHAWLENGGVPKGSHIVQECGVGLVNIQRQNGVLAFTAPPLVRSGPADDATLAELADVLNIGIDEIAAVEWVDNGPGWIAVLLHSVDAVLSLKPKSHSRFKIGVAGRYPDAASDSNDPDIEVRAFFPSASGMLFEDPVTGSLNASLAQWLISSARMGSRYIAAQGTVIGRRGRVMISSDEHGVYVGGHVVTCINGTINA